jgi:hypothetical protein
MKKMDELKGLIVDLLNHVDMHKEGYKNPEWTNKNIVNAWFRSHDHKFKDLGLFNVGKTFTAEQMNDEYGKGFRDGNQRDREY